MTSASKVSDTIVPDVLDRDVVEECTRCLAGAAVYEGTEADLALAATALARDLAETHACHAVALLDTASGEAAAYLEASELRTGQLAAALHRLTSVRGRTNTILLNSGASTAGLAL